MNNNINYDKFYMYHDHYIEPEYEVNILNFGVENLPSIFTDLNDLVKNLPESPIPELYIYEVKNVEISTMETTKHGLRIKSKRFTIDSIINLFNQNPEIIKKLPHWLIEIHLKSKFGEDSTLKEFALNKETYLGIFRARAVEHLCMKDLSESELMELVSDDSSAVRLAVLESVDAVNAIPDYILKIFKHDMNVEIRCKAHELSSKKGAIK